MPYAKLILSDLNHSPVVIRALSSLSRAHIEAVASVLGDRWSIQSLNDYDGYLSILVEPREPSLNEPAYLISGTVQQIELAEIRDEVLSTVLKATDIAAITNELSCRLKDEQMNIKRGELQA